MQSMRVKLDHARGSPSTRVLWLLLEMGERFDLAPARTYALRAGKVRMHETGAMTEWLCDTRARHLWRAPGHEGRVGWLDWLHFADTLLVRNGDPGTLDILETGLGRSDWLLGEFSGADCQIGHTLWTVARDSGRPVLDAYLARCRARPAFRAALEA